MKLTALLQAGVLALTGSFLATHANAAVINVDNASFETLPIAGLPFTACAPGCSYSIDFIPGWTNSPGDSGQFQPGNFTNTTYFDSLSDGPTSAYSGGSTISQIVLPVVQLNVVYTLLVDIGDRKDAVGAGSAFLVVNGISYAAVGTLTDGAFATFTATYTGLIGDVGKAIEIQLRSAGTQGNFDNVRLSDDIGVSGTGAVPEPGTIAMLGMGLTAFGLLRRKLVA
jgi:hypothetical protein